jgi:preprotein translocase SecE subunit
VARDRKRAKQRRERQERVSGAQARAQRAAVPPREHAAHEDEPPELASGERDLVDAHLALGRPDLAAGEELPVEPEPEHDEALVAAEGNGGGAEVAPRARQAAATPARPEGNRLATFLRGSWRELQRVQWPDRQQVAQATAVVIGFVIVAGAFLGLMDFIAAKLVDVIV